MSELIKTPYEISLWGETLVWERRDLELVNIDKASYKPGNFFSQSPSPNIFGAIPFAADCAVFNPTQRYYRLKLDGKVETSERPEELVPTSSVKPKQYRAIWVGDEFAKGTAYFIRNTQTGAMELLDSTEAKPQAGTIYFTQQNDHLPYTINSYYKEYKHCVLGSNTMTSPIRAINGKLVSKINGENVLTFTLHHRYWNDYSGKMEINPLTTKLGNESKIKLRIGEGGEEGKGYKWYDLVVKQIQENSEQKTFTYTCKDQFVNELSKSGFEVELDNELENNVGTVEELAEYILEGSDWAVGAEKSNLMQYVEEPLYELTIAEGQSIQAVNMLKGSSESFGEKKVVHVFYSQLVSQSPTLQFIYAETEKDFYADDDAIIDRDKHPNYSIDGVVYNQEGLPTWASHKNLCTNYRGMRLVRQARTKYDKTIGKYVSVYTKEGSDDEYYGFTKTEYLSPSAVINYMVNPTGFTSTTGWIGEKVSDGDVKVSITSYPPLSGFQELKNGWMVDGTGDETGNETIDANTYLRIQGIKSSHHRIMNSAIGGHRSTLKTITQGDRWILRLKCKIDDVTGPYATLDDEINKKISLRAKIANYEIDTEGGFTEDRNIDPIFVFERFDPGEDEPQPNDINGKGEIIQKQNYVYLSARATRSVSEKELKDYNKRFALCFEFFRGSNCHSVYLEDVELFPYIEYTGQALGEDGQMIPKQYFCVPNGALFSATRTDYYYYLPDATLKDYSELEPEEISQGRPSDKYALKYPEGANAFLKIRSISGKESNRFNLIQDLCEKFECWARFEVKRKMDTGEILLGKDLEGEAAEGIDGLELYRQQKFITFSENMGETYNWAGFRYGINSKSITRSQDSAGIVSKMIVKNNANEFAQNGFCTISRATENPIKENFLLNFDHYYRQKLLDPDVVTNDLYETSNGYLGYYPQLREKNKRRDELTNNLASWVIDIAHKEATLQTYKASYDAAIEEKLYTEDYACDLTGYTFNELLTKFKWYSWKPAHWTENSTFVDGVVYYEYNSMGEIVRTTDTKPLQNKTYYINKIYSQWDEDRTFIQQWAKYCQALSVIKQHGPIYRTAEAQLAQLKADYEEAEKQLKVLAEEKRALNLRFYKKYARFLQEGSWIEESYTDDNLYYLDAQSTLHTSAQPKVSYTINVLDLSALQGYENYRFELGERTYVEDIEFFGYSKDGTPCKEEVIISEVTRELDAPEKNIIKVQNYKTQFEDLFQRIAATTQSIEYHTGEYQRASGVVEEDGTITAESLDRAINKNSVILNKAKDQSVVIDDNGITTTCISNPSKMVRIIDGGVFLSLDGGKTWRTGITAAGINTSILTAGQINTADIVITNKEHSSFRWNAQGINAFSATTWGEDNISYDPAKFVRFDQYGIYGMNGTVYEQFNPDKPGTDGKVGEDKIWNEAQYALTWKGFMLRRQSEDGGQVTISSTDDIVVSAKNDEDILKTRIQIGDISRALIEAEIVDGNDPIYGIYIADKQGDPVITSMDDGQLWLRQALRVGVSDESTVTIGYGKEETETTTDENGEKVEKGTGHHEIVYAGKDSNSFVVYDDGRMKATGATITGHIEAKSGKIGNMTIGDVETTVEQSKKLDIQPKMGYNFKVGSTVFPIELEFNVVGVGIEVDDNTLLKWTLTDFKGKTYSSPAQTRPIKIPYGLFKTYSSNDTAYLEVKKLGDDQHKALAQIMAMSDGADGKDAILVVITSSNGNFFKNNRGETVLTAHVYKGGVEVDTNEPYDYLYTWTNEQVPTWRPEGDPDANLKSIKISASEVSFKGTYSCSVRKKEENNE